MSEPLVKVKRISKKFCRSLRKSLWYGLQDLGSELSGRPHHLGAPLRPEEFWAISDLSFELQRGECLGLVGHNGAGKTTLLRMLNGLIKPDSGRIEMRGRVGALIALGVGFNPILSGRENVYVNGALLGLKKAEVDRKMDTIIDFAEIGDFIDAPVQSYSSGMNVRLGFAVAAVLLKPDILFLDEVLAVGDIGFTIKCLNLVRELTRDAAVIFVSHNMQYVSGFCTRVMVLDHGKVTLDSTDVAAGIDRYFGMTEGEAQVSGTGAAQVLDLEIQAGDIQSRKAEPCIPQGAEATAVLRLEVDESVKAATVMLQVNDTAMAPLISHPLQSADGEMFLVGPGTHRLELKLGTLDLNAGKYSFVVAIRDAASSTVLGRTQGLAPFRISAPVTHWGRIVRPIVLDGPPTQG